MVAASILERSILERKIVAEDQDGTGDLRWTSDCAWLKGWGGGALSSESTIRAERDIQLIFSDPAAGFINLVLEIVLASAAVVIAHAVNSNAIPSTGGTKSREGRSQGGRSIEIRMSSSLTQVSDPCGCSPNTIQYWVVTVWRPASDLMCIPRIRRWCSLGIWGCAAGRASVASLPSGSSASTQTTRSSGWISTNSGQPELFLLCCKLYFAAASLWLPFAPLKILSWATTSRSISQRFLSSATSDFVAFSTPDLVLWCLDRTRTWGGRCAVQ